MKHPALFAILILGFFLIACDVQSGMTKKSLEKYADSPTPEIKVTPEPPIDPADVVAADTSVEGPKINVNQKPEVKEVNCSKYNRVHVNVDNRTLIVKGVCQQLMVNGDKNKITGVAFTEIVINGTGNEVQFTKFANGKRPIVADNGGGNAVLKTTADTGTK